jgi:hypothetical protein
MSHQSFIDLSVVIYFATKSKKDRGNHCSNNNPISPHRLGMDLSSDFGNAPEDMTHCVKCVTGEPSIGVLVVPTPKEIEKHSEWCAKHGFEIWTFGA